MQTEVTKIVFYLAALGLRIYMYNIIIYDLIDGITMVCLVLVKARMYVTRLKNLPNSLGLFFSIQLTHA